MSITKCLGYEYREPNQQEIDLNCDVGNEVISVNRAFLAVAHVSLTYENTWCRDPYHSPEDCIQFEEDLTNDFRENCNVGSLCR